MDSSGSAFPVHGGSVDANGERFDDPRNQITGGGLTRREYFAAMALQGIISGMFGGNNVGFTAQGNVVAAYEYADAMLKASQE